MGFESMLSVDKKNASVYKNMKEDPAYGTVIDFDHSVDGYTMAELKDGKINTICGDNGEVPYLYVGQIVKIVGEPIHVNGFDSGKDAEEIEIISFSDPNTVDNNIVRVKQGNNKFSLKPRKISPKY